MYVANSAGAYGFSIDDSSGALSPLARSPFQNVAGQSLAIHPGGEFIYVSNSNDETITGFAIDPNTGFLTPLPGEGAATFSTPVATAVDPTGQFAYVVNRTSRSVSVYALDAMTGALRVAGTAPTTSDPVGITLRPPD
jgi:6-phosphogluconolactonase (cycloisomerase 2 family)